MYFLEYQKSMKEFSRYLRKNSTLSEVLLWNELKAGKMLGYKFNRQRPLGNYIVDFYCSKLSLVIEVDGFSHESEEASIEDVERQKILEKMGLKFIRVDDLDIKFDLSNVLMEIETFILNWQDLQAKNL
jgi:very-short-patch-repair endonuclease